MYRPYDCHFFHLSELWQIRVQASGRVKMVFDPSRILLKERRH